MSGQNYQRPKEALRLDFRGVNTVAPLDAIPPGKYPYAQNIRAYFKGGVTGRNLQNLLFDLGSGVGTPEDLRYLEDPFNVSASQYLFSRWHNAPNGKLYINSTPVSVPSGANGFVGIGAMVPFRPNNSPQPWMYISDERVMIKVRSDGTQYQMGIKEPQSPPTITLVSGPLTGQFQYVYKWRSSVTGAVSNPSPLSAVVTASGNQMSVATSLSTDPQVDTADVYRIDVNGTGSLENLTYVGSIPNGGTLPDFWSDLALANNPIASYADFEPFPSIGLPISGIGSWPGGSGPALLTVTTGSLPLNLLPGTPIIFMGFLVGTTYARPVDATHVELMLATTLSPSVNVPFQIRNPVLAATPVPFMWGPTDNVQFMFAVGDKNNPGRLYWTTGNNPDTAADTNTQDVTSGSEILMNGCLVGGVGMVYSNQRAWLIYPNFFNALATVTGVAGSQFTLVESIANRGLAAKRGLTTDGGGNVYFISTDGVYVSPGGSGSRSITDDDLYNLFPHEGSIPQAIVRAAITIYPPSYGGIDEMKLSFASGYLYFDYLDINGTPTTLVYDAVNDAWVFDDYFDLVTVHGYQDITAGGFSHNPPVVAGTSGKIYQLTNSGSEVVTCILATPCYDNGDARADKHFGDLFIRAQTQSGHSISVEAFQNLYQTPVATSPSLLTGSPAGTQLPFIVDFSSNNGLYARDVEMIFSWTLDEVTAVFFWQPSIIEVPDTVANRPSDWDNGGTEGAKWIQGALIEADSFNVAKDFIAQSGDDLSGVAFEETAQFNGRSIKAFSLSTPLVAHTVRLVSTDGVPWRVWNVQWVFEPYPELCRNWQSEGVSHGIVGWQHIREMNIGHISTANLSLTLTPDYGPPIVLTVPNSGGIQTKTKITVIGPNKFKVLRYGVTSSSPFRLFLESMESKIGAWGRSGAYQVVKPFGGPSKLGAQV